MQRRFNPLEADARWQAVWDEKQTFKASDSSDRPRSYVLEMFPYPSGASISAMCATIRWATCWRGSGG